jgi:hypothetical protein
MIRTDIPFYADKPTAAWPEGEHCVQMSLKMMLGVLMPGRNFGLAELERITHKAPTTGSFATHHLIWLVDQGFEVQHWDMHDWLAFRDEGMEYIRRTLGDDAVSFLSKGYDIAAEQTTIDKFLTKVPIIKNHPTVEDAEKLFNDRWLVRASVNGRTINNLPGYLGHSVIITGFEGDEVVFHDPDTPGTPHRRATRKLFQTAMDSFGGELDAVRARPPKA